MVGRGMRGVALHDAELRDRRQHAGGFDRVHAARMRTLGGRASASADPLEFALEQHALVAARKRRDRHRPVRRMPPEFAGAADRRRARPEQGHGRRSDHAPKVGNAGIGRNEQRCIRQQAPKFAAIPARRRSCGTLRRRHNRARSRPRRDPRTKRARRLVLRWLRPARASARDPTISAACSRPRAAPHRRVAGARTARTADRASRCADTAPAPGHRRASRTMSAHAAGTAG